MTREARSDLVVAIVLLTVAAAVPIATAGYPVADREVGPRTFPVLLSALLGLVSLLLLGSVWRRTRRNESPTRSQSQMLDRTMVMRIVIVGFSIAVYVAVVELLGFILTSVLYLAFVTVFFGERRWWAVASFSLACVVVVYVMFGMLARVPFPYGVIEALLARIGVI